MALEVGLVSVFVQVGKLRQELHVPIRTCTCFEWLLALVRFSEPGIRLTRSRWFTVPPIEQELYRRQAGLKATGFLPSGGITLSLILDRLEGCAMLPSKLGLLVEL